MIKLVSPTETLSGDDVVGRIILRRGIPDWPVYKYPARAKHVDDRGVCMVYRLHANHDPKEGRWMFTDQATDDAEFIPLSEIHAVCDTALEVNEMQVISRRSTVAYHAARDRIDADFRALATALNDNEVQSSDT